MSGFGIPDEYPQSLGRQVREKSTVEYHATTEQEMDQTIGSQEQLLCHLTHVK